MSSTQFDEIPIEMLTQILQTFDLVELGKCRLVSKKFKFCADQVRLKELAVSVDQYQHLSSIPFKYHTYQPVAEQNLLCLLDLKLFSSVIRSAGIFKNLTYFKLFGYVNWQQFDITVLNELAKLKQLDFDCSIVIDGVVRLGPVNLEILSFSQTISRRNMQSDDHLLIDAPKLRVFACQRLDDWMQIVHPHTIENLELNFSNQSLLQFVNLKVFQKRFGSTVDRETISKLPARLSEFHIYMTAGRMNVIYKLRNTINALLQQQRVLERQHLKIFLMGIEVIESNKRDVDSFHEQFRHYEIFRIPPEMLFGITQRESQSASFFPQALNYKQLAGTLPFYQSFDFGRIKSLGYDPLPADFFSHFMNIREVTVRQGMLNHEHFADFLSRTRNLTSLFMANFGMEHDKTFFRNLPSICPLLSKLILFSNRLSFEFICQFKMLVEFGSNELPSLLEAPEAFRKCKYLNSFRVLKRLDSNIDFVKIKRIPNFRAPKSHHRYLVMHTDLAISNGSMLKLDELNDVCNHLCGN